MRDKSLDMCPKMDYILSVHFWTLWILLFTKKGVRIIGKGKAAYEEYSREQKVNGDFYCTYQKRTGLSEAEFWCVFSVYSKKCTYQHELSRYLFMNRQTVNSALKQLEKKGLIQMIIPAENQRVRKILLTNQGVAFSHKHFDFLQALEEKAWDSLSPEEQTAMLNGLHKINAVLLSALQNE